jgi:DtxR family Mn-dependent transcriptional regulator
VATETKENYLKAIYFLDQKHSDISLTSLANEMGVSKPTVNDMVKKLEVNGWLHYEKYKPLRLSERGRKTAALILRKHRLTEMFLVKVMGFGWEEVHSIAEEIEHIDSDQLFDRMDEILGFPIADPHGSPIPDKEGNINSLDYQLLSNIPVNTKVVLRGLRDSSKEFLMFLNNKKLQLGTEIFLHQCEPFDKSIIVSYDKYIEVQLSYSISSRLLVELV